MEQWFDKVAIVTGATSGIGQEIATQLVKRNLKVVGLGRRTVRLDELKVKLANESGQFYPICCDITKQSDIVNAINWTKQNLGGIDILINNAGVAPEIAGYCDSQVDSWKRVLDTNVLGVTIITQEAIKLMNERNVAGYIININSILGHKIPYQIASFLNMYSASKYAITGLTETLRMELAQKKSKIRVTSISPGLVNTELFESQVMNMLTNEIGMQALEASDISDAILYVLSTPPRVNVAEMIIYPTGDPL